MNDKTQALAIQVSTDNKHWLVAYAYNRKTGARLRFAQIIDFKYTRFKEISLKDFKYLEKCMWEDKKDD